MSTRRIIATAAAAVLAGAVFAGCGDDSKDLPAASSNTTEAASDDSTTLTLVATDFAFDKTELRAQGGEAVTLVLKNEGAVEHNLTIEDFNVDADAEPGKTVSRVASVRPGTHEYHCEYHPAKMRGTFTVS